MDYQPRFWIQYHNYDNIGFPAKELLKSKLKLQLNNFDHWISTSKPSILKSYGDTVFLILGITVINKKQYFLWSKTIVDEVVQLKDKNGNFNAHGVQTFMEKPVWLNGESGFDTFLNFCGNFGLGFHNISKNDFVATLENLSNTHRFPADKRITYKQYLKDFWYSLLDYM